MTVSRFFSRFSMAAILLAAGIAMPQAAVAAEPGRLECLLTAVSDQERAALSRSVAEQRQDDSAEAPFRRALTRCIQVNAWSQADAGNAALYTIGALGQLEISRRLAALGIDVAELERAMLSDTRLTEELETSLATGGMATNFAERHDALLARLMAGRPGDQEVAALIGSFVGFRGMMEIGRRRFGAN